MPLALAALYARGIDIYLAPTWDNSDVWVPTLRHITGCPAATPRSSALAAAVQASYVLMDREASLGRVAALTAAAAAEEAELVVFPEVFVPGTPIWIDTRPIWDGDGSQARCASAKRP